MSYDYDRTAARTGPYKGSEVAHEILDRKIDGKKVQQHIDDFVATVVGAAQETHQKIEKGAKEIEGMYEVTLSKRDLQQAVLKGLERKWGKDRMAPLLADALANLEYVW